MGIEDPRGDPNLNKKFDHLAEQAEREIAETLLASGKVDSMAEAEMSAEQMLQDRCNEAGVLYEGVVKKLEDTTLPSVTREALIRGLLGEMELRFAQGGHIRDVTAKRIAAASLQIYEQMDWET